jgi:hypothetical protein
MVAWRAGDPTGGSAAGSHAPTGGPIGWPAVSEDPASGGGVIDSHGASVSTRRPRVRRLAHVHCVSEDTQRPVIRVIQ